MSIVTRFRLDTRGATAIEYGLFLALIAVAIIGSARLVGSRIVTNFLLPTANALS